MRLLQRANIRVSATHPVEPAIEIEGRITAPGALHNVQIFLRPLIALGLRREVAIAFLLGVRLAGNDVECEAAAGQLIESGRFAGEQSGRDEPRPVRDQIGQSLGLGCRVHGYEEALGRR